MEPPPQRIGLLRGGPGATGRCEGVPALHSSVVHRLLSTGRSAGSLNAWVLPAPSHWRPLQSPAVGSTSLVPAGVNENPHTPAPVQVAAGTKLTVTIEQSSQHVQHTLGHFRLSVTDDARAAEWGRAPLPILEALKTTAAKRTPQQIVQDIQAAGAALG